MTDAEKWGQLCKWAIIPHRITVDWFLLFANSDIVVKITLAVGEAFGSGYTLDEAMNALLADIENGNNP